MIVRCDNQHEISIPADIVILMIKHLLREGAWVDAIRMFFVTNKLLQLFKKEHLMPGFTFPLLCPDTKAPVNVKFDAIKQTLLANLKISHSLSSANAKFFRRHGIQAAKPDELSFENLMKLRDERDLTAKQLDEAEARWNQYGLASMIFTMFAASCYTMHRSVNYTLGYADIMLVIAFAFLVTPISNSYGLFRTLLLHELYRDAFIKQYEIADAITQFFEVRRKRLGKRRLDLQEHLVHLKLAEWDDGAQLIRITPDKKKAQPARFFSKAIKMEVAGEHLTDNKMAEFMMTIRRKK